jgi:formate dehydrogenase accessory protein FdhE
MIDQYSLLISTLEQARSEHSDLALMIDLHMALARAQANVSADPGKQSLDKSMVAQALDRGQPLLSLLVWTPEPKVLTETWVEICNILATHRADLAESFTQMTRLSVDEITALVHTYIVGDDITESVLAPSPALTHVALNHALRPFLRAEAEHWHDWFVHVPWYQGYCPFCGGGPDFATLEKGETRRLLCSRCDTEWKIGRVGCPFCGDGTDSYFEDETYRLYVCDQCHHYLKTLDARKLNVIPSLPAERVLTLGMDVVARDKGYVGV